MRAPSISVCLSPNAWPISCAATVTISMGCPVKGARSSKVQFSKSSKWISPAKLSSFGDGKKACAKTFLLGPSEPTVPPLSKGEPSPWSPISKAMTISAFVAALTSLKTRGVTSDHKSNACRIAILSSLFAISDVLFWWKYVRLVLSQWFPCMTKYDKLSSYSFVGKSS